jgi:hypothetical protein
MTSADKAIMLVYRRSRYRLCAVAVLGDLPAWLRLGAGKWDAGRTVRLIPRSERRLGCHQVHLSIPELLKPHAKRPDVLWAFWGGEIMKMA